MGILYKIPWVPEVFFLCLIPDSLWQSSNSMSTVYFILGVSRMDLWSQGVYKRTWLFILRLISEELETFMVLS